MTISELIAAREPDWQALETLLGTYSNPFRTKSPEDVAQLTSLYRVVSSDLALAESHHLPMNTVEYLNNLVGRAHHCLYRKRKLYWSDFARVTLFDTPRWIIADPSFWVALALFWVPYLVCQFVCKTHPEIASQIVGEETLDYIRSMYVDFYDVEPIDRLWTVGRYLFHNGSIGFKCFCLSVLGLIPGLFILVHNAVILGTIFGYMQSAAVDAGITANFIEFTTAHGPFELTAIVLTAAAGMRIGFSVIMTRGYSRLDAIRRAAIQAFPTVMTAFVLFFLAAGIEALISPGKHRWLCDVLGTDALTLKIIVKYVSIALLVFYFFVLGVLGVIRTRFFQR